MVKVKLVACLSSLPSKVAVTAISVAPSNLLSSTISADRSMFWLSLSSSINVSVVGSTVLLPALPLIVIGRSVSTISSLIGKSRIVPVACFSPAVILRTVSLMRKRLLSPSSEIPKSTKTSVSTAVSSVTATVTSTSVSPASSRTLLGFTDSANCASASPLHPSTKPAANKARRRTNDFACIIFISPM